MNTLRRNRMIKKKQGKYLKLLLIIFLFLLLDSKVVSAESVAYPKLKSEAAVLMDAKTGQVLYKKNMDKKEYPASITKIMTGLIALEQGHLNDTLTMSDNAVFSIERDSSNIALDVGEKITLEQALYGMAIASANDAANGIAEFIAGDLETFAQLMNKRAKELGAFSTNFTNANGLPNLNNYTTAYDMALIMRQAIKMSKFREIFTEDRYEMSPTNKQKDIRYFNNRNDFLNGKYEYDGIIASKIGWTPEAQHTLVTAAKKGDRKLIVVVMKSQNSDDKYEDTMKLFDNGFDYLTKNSLNEFPIKDDIRNTNNITIYNRLLHNDLLCKETFLNNCCIDFYNFENGQQNCLVKNIFLRNCQIFHLSVSDCLHLRYIIG